MPTQMSELRAYAEVRRMVRQPGQRTCLCDAGRGAFILGKTTTSEFGAGTTPPPTRTTRPFNTFKNGGRLVHAFHLRRKC